MTATTDAYLNATGSDPARLGAVIAMLVGTVMFLVLAYVVMQLWDAWQDKSLRAATAKQYAVRATILVMVFFAVVLRH